MPTRASRGRTPPSVSARLAALLREAEAAGLDALAVVPGPNLAYLTGLSLHLSERPSVLFATLDGRCAFLLPSFEAAEAEALPFEAELFAWRDEEGYRGAFRDALAALRLGGRSLGVEGRRIRFLELDAMARSGAAPRPADADPVFASLRMRKAAPEVAAMRRAVAVAERAFLDVLPLFRPDVTEHALASELLVRLLRGGSSALPFEPIVATGPHAAHPHAAPGEALLAPGDIVVVDWGAKVDGYCSDITRCVRVPGAAPDPALLAAHEAVREANRAGRAAARPGATGQDVDRAARAVLEAAGLGPRFLHRTGHGLGLEVHEEPDMKEGSLTPLAPGMTFTVEPGAYLPGLGGVRVEDDVLVTEAGPESLTTLPRAIAVGGAEG